MKKYQTMTELATLAIREGIIKGTYSPGTRLKPNELEKDLDLGRVSIREALIELVGTGLVQSIPNKGMLVAMPSSFEEISVIFEGRSVLEGNLAFHAALNVTSTIIEKLEVIYHDMENRDSTDRDRFLLNREFHLALYKKSGWPHTCRIVSQLLDQVLAFYAFYIKDIKIDIDFRPFNKEHFEIIEALKDRNSKKVQDITVANIKRGYAFLQTVSDRKNKAAGN